MAQLLEGRESNRLNRIKMKKVVLFLTIMFMSMSYAQEVKQIPQINVSGEGKVKIAPDQVCISATVETKGNNAKDVKKQNDEKIDAVLKFIKKMNVPVADYKTKQVSLNPQYDYEKKKTSYNAKDVKKQNDEKIDAVLKFIKKMNVPVADYKTKQVSLNPQYDYEKKKTSYNATQTVEIVLKDLSKYDEVMEGLVQQGINRIDNVSFESSKLAQHQSEARKLAIKDAKAKAEDYVSVLGQKVGKAIAISDNSQVYNPRPMYAAMKSMAMDTNGGAENETLAVGEIEITANVNVSFVLD
eukprot:TRINITY_DN13217_c0_g1_i1.p1 TRINITY_DN13217_c0_g1~~TRINITY_DN13217_c0_g1_i1.p1  ORF type:complete len:298 (+),score=-30.33 TRINITY_DN13217_c0_g1_i1:24-917(+)